jgi:hypothetical protein
MGVLAVALVLAIEDAQEMFQRSNVLVCVCVSVCVLRGVDKIPLCYGRGLPGETMEGELHPRK